MSAKEKIASWLKERKDSSVSFVAEKLLHKRLEPYGQLMEFDLDSSRQRVSLKILLKGEIEPVSVTVEQYVLTSDGNRVSLTIKHASTSRPWLTQLVDEFVVGRPFPLPEQYNSVYKLLL